MEPESNTQDAPAVVAAEPNAEQSPAPPVDIDEALDDEALVPTPDETEEDWTDKNDATYGYQYELMMSAPGGDTQQTIGLSRREYDYLKKALIAFHGVLEPSPEESAVRAEIRTAKRELYCLPPPDASNGRVVDAMRPAIKTYDEAVTAYNEKVAGIEVKLAAAQERLAEIEETKETSKS